MESLSLYMYIFETLFQGVLKKTSTPISAKKPSKPIKSRVRQRASLA